MSLVRFDEMSPGSGSGFGIGGPRSAAALIGSCVLLLGLLLGCGQGEVSVAPAPVRIAVSSPSSKPAGRSVRNAAELALEESGSKAGRHRVELLLLDSDLRAEVPREGHMAREAIADPAVVAYVGPLHSTLARFSLPLLNQAGIVQISPSVTWPGFTREGFAPGEPEIYYPTGRRHFFRLIPPDNVQGASAARWATGQGFHTAFVVDHGLDYGRGVATVFEAAAREGGLEVVGRASLDLTAEMGPGSIPEVVRRVHAAGADLLYFGGGIQTGGQEFLCALREVWPEAQILGAEGLVPGRLGDGCSPGRMDGVLVSQPMPLDHLTSPLAATFRRTYQERYGGLADPFAVNTYEAIRVLLAAIASTEVPSREAVLDAVAGQTGHSGVLGDWQFDEHGDPVPAPIALMRYEGDGWVFVESID